ncbi:sigma-70 family RNA polymerase sigma factor [Arthrobacter sp. MI7-26]|uniref:zf-HC2 domain-containing protein n=1 Tax=Arthrobacter sp. MI7-26 TaxID=2993653 RepID=UPI00224884EF|nr:sigma-70 family RNA polymerase sigma factor [Arthrobacter sp. MI7-26]MCX2749665.1 sigma-70 family RNA polymerase sigma factor [Arthrobacter sp. MI7-26]
MAPSTTASTADAASDGQLIAMVRSGDLDAYDGLYARHVSIASTVARKNVDNLSDADDVVAEAFQSVLQSLVAGKGPEHFFRAYLLSAVTRLSHHKNRKAGRTLPTSDETVLDHKMTPDDPAIQAFESHTVARAFRSLPERWQAALWYLDVERMKPAAVAPILGLSPNAVSALGMRAREGLRRQYLQMHVSETAQGACTEFVSQLGSYVRGGLSKSAAAKVRDHLDGCAKCTAVLLDLKDVQGTMRAVLLPLITGVPLAAWGGKVSGLGVVGHLPGVPAASGVAGISQPLVMSILAALAVGLVVGALGIVEVLTGQPAPRAYQDAEVRTTQPPRPTSTSTAAQPQAPAPVVTASPEPPLLPAWPSVPEPPVIAEPPFALPAPAPAPAPARSAMPAPTSVPASTPSPTPSRTSTPTPTPSPSSTPSPTPTLTPNRAKVSGTASRTDSGADPTSATLEPIFTLSPGSGLGKAAADFSVNKRGSISSSSVTAPAGWTCSPKPLDPSSISCATNSVQAGELKFTFNVTIPHYWHSRTLTYGLSGTGIETNTFYNKF